MFSKMLAYLFFVVTAKFLDFKNLGINKSAIPPTLYKSEYKSFLAIAPCAFEEVTIKEIGERAPEQWLSGIRFFLSSFLFRLLRECGFVLCMSRKIKFCIKHFSGFSYSIYNPQNEMFGEIKTKRSFS